MLRILSLTGSEMNGCSWYRIYNFAKEARRQGLAQLEFINPTFSTENLARIIANADILYCRLNETLPYIFEEFGLEKLHKPIVLDLDDAIDGINPWSDSYQTQGTMEYRLKGLENIGIKDGTYLWKDGEKGFSIKENKERLNKYFQLVRMASAVIVTTLELKNYVEQYNKNVVVIPNAINFDLFPVLPLKKDNTVTITWSGGSSHYEDIYEPLQIVKELMNEYPNLYYAHAGQAWGYIKKTIPESRLKESPWVTADGHGFRMATLNADIGIAPLGDFPFNRYKSSVKYYEYSAIKIPTLAKNMPPYADDIIDGKTGLLYDTAEEFKAKLERLINDPLLRVNLADEAYKYVTEYRDIKDVTKDWVMFLSELALLYKKQQYNNETAQL